LALTAACQDKQKSVDSIVRECQVFLDGDNLEGASSCYRKALLANPQQAQEISKTASSAIFKKCVEFKNKKNYEKSIICFESVSELMPNSANVQFNLADSYYEYYEQRNYSDSEILNRAEEAVEKGLSIKNDDIAANSLYARILRESGKLKEALEQHKKLVKFDPKSSLFWTGLGLTQQKLNQNNEAVKSFEEALNLNPNNTETLFFLGVSYENISENKKAIDVFEKLLNIDPNYDEVEKRLKTLREKRELEKSKKAKSKIAGT
jgi:tetratricopeptide (TPR) repeat protein